MDLENIYFFIYCDLIEQIFFNFKSYNRGQNKVYLKLVIYWLEVLMTFNINSSKNIQFET